MRLAQLGKEKSLKHKMSISLSKTGEKNPMYGKSALYSFENESMGIIENDITIEDMCSKYKLKSCGLYQLKNGKARSYKGWAMLISSQVVEGKGSTEGSEAREMSPNNNFPHENRPTHAVEDMVRHRSESSGDRDKKPYYNR